MTALALALAAAVPMGAARTADAPAVAMMGGACTALSVDGADDAAGCVPSVVRWALPNGRVMVLFGHSHLMLAFTGPPDGEAWGGAGSQPIDMVRATTPDRPKEAIGTPATGTCVYDNPCAGKAQITCDAAALGHHWYARFTTDGTPPHAPQ